MREAKEVNIKSAVASQRVGSHQPLGGLQSQAREADVRALAELSRALDKKVGAMIFWFYLMTAFELRYSELRDGSYVTEQTCYYIAVDSKPVLSYTLMSCL